MRKILTSLSIILLSSTCFADINIAVGQENGGYERAGKALAARLTQRGIPSEITNYNGSDEITLAMCSGKAQVGFAQIDAIFARFNEGCKLKPVGSYASEYAFLLFPPNASHDELDDFDGSERVLVDTIGSGSDLFWHTIVAIENSDNGNQSDWSKATAVNEPVLLADTLAQFGDIDAVLIVRTKNSPDVLDLLERGWELGELWDKDINDQEFNGKSLYESEKITISNGRVSDKDYVYQVSSFVLATKEFIADRAKFAAIAKAIR